MPTASTIAVFCVAALALLLVPGPVVLYTVARSVHQGRKAGLISAAAAAVGDLAHVCGAALGVSALLLSSALAFSVVKYAGAAYLIYLGLRTILARDTHSERVVIQPRSESAIFRQGLLVSLLNP